MLADLSDIKSKLINRTKEMLDHIYKNSQFIYCYQIDYYFLSYKKDNNILLKIISYGWLGLTNYIHSVHQIYLGINTPVYQIMFLHY